MVDPASVQSRQELVAFITGLGQDLMANEAAWENSTLERYLEALAGWTSDMDGWFSNRKEVEPDQPTWSLVAQMLLAASMYE
ncbi:MAG TPA: hypothetical protein VMZ73_06675 [Acidimicrobiales bacterium]|nr:hypothetical protein [Acidimicrobiales bacterium]